MTHSAGVTWLSEIEFSFGHLTAASKKKKHIIMICFSVFYLFYILVCRDVLFYLNLITPTSLFKGPALWTNTEFLILAHHQEWFSILLNEQF